ncbi:MAG: type II secretion system protein GspG [Candidatus Sumerlaeia bacterium]|nr:type II secretion system protein GspG [Candidatus Sumerlaeia bacterium]
MFSQRSGAFTLIELLIVVAIIAILAAIAVPNFLEAQVRAKVSRVQSDLRSLATALEAYRVDFNRYPEGTDTLAKMPEQAVAFFGPLAGGYYTWATRNPSGAVAGRDFATLTTPVAFITSLPLDPFAAQVGGNVTYAYRDAKARGDGYVLTSFGPDADVLSPGGVGTVNTNPLSTRSDTKAPARLGDINERAVIEVVERTNAGLIANVNAGYGSLLGAMEDLRYDPTNGTASDGDLYRVAP